MDQTTLDCWHNIHLMTCAQNLKNPSMPFVDSGYVQPQIQAFDDHKSAAFDGRLSPEDSPSFATDEYTPTWWPSSRFSIGGQFVAASGIALSWAWGTWPSTDKHKVRRSYYTGIVARRRNLRT
jgi:hypothetical protein